MALVTADTGAAQMLKVIFNETSKWSYVTIKLFTNSYTPVDTTTSGNLTEAAGGGYTAKTVMTNVAHVAATAITSSSVANPTNILATAHGMSNSDIVTIASHTGSTPTINGTHTITYVDANNFTIPVNVTVGGTGGTVSRGFNQSQSSNIEQTAATSVPFVFTGALTGNATIYGFWVESSGGVFLWAELLDSSYTPAASGDTLSITPKHQISKGTPT